MMPLPQWRPGGHGYDLVVPSANYIPIWRENGLIVPLADSKLPNKDNIAPAWKDLPCNPMRARSVPWQWGSIAVAVCTEDTEVLKKKPVIWCSWQRQCALFQRECRRGGIHAGQYEDRAGNGNT